MKIVLTIFALPQEIDDLEIVVQQLKRASRYLSPRNQWALDITVATSDYLVDWKHSSIPKSFFFERLERLYNISDWCDRHFLTSDSMNGSLIQKAHSFKRHDDADIFIWLDSDIIFDERTLSFIEISLDQLPKESLFILTPEIVKMWDDTWDCIVNENYLNESHDYQKGNNPYIDAGVKGEVTLQTVQNNFEGQPRFKFGSGFFATMPSRIFEIIPFPESFGHYGLEDTFIMWAAEKLVREKKYKIEQYKLKNLVVCENYKYRTIKPYSAHMSLIDRKNELKQLSNSNFQKELSKIG